MHEGECLSQELMCVCVCRTSMALSFSFLRTALSRLGPGADSFLGGGESVCGP